MADSFKIQFQVLVQARTHVILAISSTVLGTCLQLPISAPTLRRVDQACCLSQQEPQSLSTGRPPSLSAQEKEIVAETFSLTRQTLESSRSVKAIILEARALVRSYLSPIQTLPIIAEVEAAEPRAQRAGCGVAYKQGHRIHTKVRAWNFELLEPRWNRCHLCPIPVTAKASLGLACNATG